jgi:hypothetical protein
MLQCEKMKFRNAWPRGILIFVFLYTDDRETIFFTNMLRSIDFVFLYTDDRETIFLPTCYGILIFVFAYIVAIVNFFFSFNILRYVGICFSLYQWYRQLLFWSIYTKVYWFLFWSICLGILILVFVYIDDVNNFCFGQ